MFKYKCIIFDLDGTIYFGNELAPRANDVITKLRNKFDTVFFMTNNSAKTREQIHAKLVSMGIDVKIDEVITSSYAIAKYLKYNNFTDVYCIGTEYLKEEIELQNINTKSKKPQAIVVGYNSNFKLDDLNELLNINLEKYKLIIANRERCYPKEKGYIVPGAGPIVSAVENLLNKNVDIVIGKPSIEMLKMAVLNLNILPNEICVIGDSFESDIEMAKKYGADGILITKDKKYNCKCIEKLADLLDIIK
uniref:HAD-IIA family hydrolase n=1 Tax=Candidatus Ruminimicrobium bovinum TaxID=3242779 RepID=UPI0039B854EB